MIRCYEFLLQKAQIRDQLLEQIFLSDQNRIRDSNRVKRFLSQITEIRGQLFGQGFLCCQYTNSWQRLFK